MYTYLCTKPSEVNAQIRFIGSAGVFRTGTNRRPRTTNPPSSGGTLFNRKLSISSARLPNVSRILPTSEVTKTLIISIEFVRARVCTEAEV